MTEIDHKYGWKYALLAGFLWEVKDGFICWQKYGAIGGDGFSYKDYTADFAGMIIGYFFHQGSEWLVQKYLANIHFDFSLTF
jgi:hypothetical protein